LDCSSASIESLAINLPVADKRYETVENIMNIITSKMNIVIFAILVAAFWQSAIAFAAPGDLDPGFGNGGKVITNFASVADHTRRILQQPDGKILILTSDVLDNIGVPRSATIRRFSTAGQIDLTFGVGGALAIQGLRDFAILPDGRIIVVITSYSTSTKTNIERYSADGNPDNTFSAEIGVTGERFEGRRLKIQTDGKIVACGATGSGSTFFVRLQPNGAFDSSFGTNGISYGYGTDFAYTIIPPWTLDSTGDLVIQQDGKIIYGIGEGWSSDYSVGRLNSDGTIDTGFGNDGIVGNVIPIPSYPYDTFSFGLQVLATKKILVSGTAVQWYGSDSVADVTRLEPDGSLDTSFGNNGSISLTSDSLGPAKSMIGLPNGKILLGGTNGADFVFRRLDPNGSIDQTFGINGVITTPIGEPSTQTSVQGMVLQPDGKMVAAGSITSAGSPRIGLLRLANVAGSAHVTARPFDFDGDGRADVSVYRPSDRTWYIDRSQAGFAATQFGLATDKMAPADYDGDGKADVAVYRPSEGNWYILNSSNSSLTVRSFGTAEDVPVPGDFDGDGKDDVAVFRPSTGTWWMDRTTAGTAAVQYGLSGDIPVTGDFDGDGTSDIAMIRQTNTQPANLVWYMLRSAAGESVINWGLATDKLVPADYDGDGKIDIAVYRPSEGAWYIVNSSTGQYSVQLFGSANDIPVPADYDGDGKADTAIFRPTTGTWWINRTTAGVTISQFGLSDDKPIPNNVGN
jgi:uncharacterized delta-60 repeat protein